MAKFEYGQLVATRGVHSKGQEDSKFLQFCWKCFQRHINGDWGEMCEEDKALNDAALESGEDRLFSSYQFDEDTKLWIITEWDRSVTTMLFPDEY